MLVHFCLFAAVLVFTGCTSSSFLGDPVEPYQDVLKDAPPELIAFNEQFEQRPFTLVFTDSTRVRNVEQIALGMQTTRYRVHGMTSKYVPTASVARIETRTRGGFFEGASIGAAAGATIVGIGLTMAMFEKDPCADAVWICVPPSAATIGLGLFIGTVGALTLGGINGALHPGRRVNVYLAPLERYLSPKPPDS